MPGVTYERAVQFTSHGPVALHVVVGPRPTGLYALRPVLSNETIAGTERVTAMQKRLSAGATMVGVNGDFFNLGTGRPSGVLLRDGIVDSPPYGDRSSVGLAADGTLDVRRIEFFGTWRGLGQRRAINDLNQLPGPNGVSLFTPSYGPATPAQAGAVAAVIAPLPAGDPQHRPRRPGDPARRRRRPDPRRRCRAPRSGNRGAEADRGVAGGNDPGAAHHLPPRLDGDHPGDRRRPCPRPRTQAGLSGARGLLRRPARPANSAHCRGPARGRPDPLRRVGRAAARLQRRDDQLRARADPRAPRRRHRLGVRRRRLDDARVRRHPAEPSVRSPRRARRLDLAPAHVLRRLRPRRSNRSSHRTATASPRARDSPTRSSGPRP